MKRIDTTEHLYSPAQAEAIADEMRAADPDWSYTAKHDPKGTGYSFIEVYDDEGVFIGKL